MLSKAVSTVLVNSFWLLKKWPDSKNRNSRPKLEKLGATIYAEALGDFASHIEAESEFSLLLAHVHKWHYVSRIKCYFPGLSLSTDLNLIWDHLGQRLPALMQAGEDLGAGLFVWWLYLCEHQVPWIILSFLGLMEKWPLGWSYVAPISV